MGNQTKEPLKTEVDHVVYRVTVDDIANYPQEKMMNDKPAYVNWVGYSSDPERKNSLLVHSTEEGVAFDIHVWFEYFRNRLDNGTL